MYCRLRTFIHRLVLKPLMRTALNLEVQGAEMLDRRGPAIVIANHNSHVDTAVLLAAFPTSRINRVRPVAAADYFLRNRLLRWFSTRIVGILPLNRRHTSDTDPLSGAGDSLAAGEILVMFPEGSRGQPGVLGDFKSGVARLARRYPDIPVLPVWLDGCDRVMPKGRRLPRPTPCRAAVGRPLFIRPGETSPEFLMRLRASMIGLRTRPGAAA